MDGDSPASRFSRLNQLWLDLPLRWKGLVVVAIPLSALVFGFAISYLVDFNQERSRKNLERAERVIKNVQGMDLSLRTAQDAIQGFLLIDDRHLLDQYGDAVQKVPGEMRKLDQMLRKQPDQRQRFSSASHAVEEWLHTLATLQRVDASGSAAARESIASGIATANVSAGEVRRVLDEIAGRQQEIRRQAARSVNELDNLMLLVDAASVIPGVLGGILATLLFSRGVAARMKRLEENSARLEALAPLLPMPAGNDEIGQLGRTISRVRGILKDRQDALISAREQAEKANGAKSEFLSRMSHELRTPLNAILGFGQILEVEESLQPRQLQAVEQILKGGRHLLDLVNEVLDIAQVESGNLPLSLEAVGVADLIDGVVSLMRPQAQKTGVTLLTQNLTLPDCHLRGDNQRLRQVLLNLVGNGIKYNRAAGSVTLSARSKDNLVELAVQDTGLGVPAEHLERLFVPFDRLGAEKTNVEGTGLGLALSRRLVEAMGGQLRVESCWQVGSTFSVVIPIGVAPEYPVAASGEGLSPYLPDPSRKHTLLYIEDNLSNLRLIESIIERWDGVELLTALQGQIGLELARAHQPDVILLDMHLPDLHGRQVLARLQAEPLTRDIPVIILSADATSGEGPRLVAAGAYACMTKPFVMRELIALVDEAFQRNAGGVSLPESVSALAPALKLHAHDLHAIGHADLADPRRRRRCRGLLDASALGNGHAEHRNGAHLYPCGGLALAGSGPNRVSPNESKAARMSEVAMGMKCMLKALTACQMKREAITHFHGVAVLLLAGALAALPGCTGSDPGAAFDGVGAKVASRSAHPYAVRWNRDAAADAEAQRAVQTLLRRRQGVLTAQTAAQIAVLNNRSLQAACENIGIAQAEYIQAGLLGNPEFSTSFRFPGTAPFATDAEYALAANILDLFLLPARRKVAAAELERARLRVAADVLGLIADTKAAVYTLEAEQQLLDRLHAGLQANEAAAELARRLRDAGNITDLEASQQQTPAAQAQVDALEAQARLRPARERLNRLMGLDGADAAGWKVAGSLPPIPAHEPARHDLEALAGRARLDLAIARANVDAIGQALALRTRTRYLPASITLGVDTERDTSRQHVTGPTLDLQLPIFDQGQGAIGKLAAQFRQASRRLEAAEINARSEVREAAGLVQANRALAARYRETLVPQQRQIIDQTQLQFNAMQNGGFDLLTARERELSTERAYIKAWRGYWLARVGLERALAGGSGSGGGGGGSDEDYGNDIPSPGTAGITGSSASTRAAAVKGLGD